MKRSRSNDKWKRLFHLYKQVKDFANKPIYLDFSLLETVFLRTYGALSKMGGKTSKKQWKKLFHLYKLIKKHGNKPVNFDFSNVELSFLKVFDDMKEQKDLKIYHTFNR